MIGAVICLAACDVDVDLGASTDAPVVPSEPPVETDVAEPEPEVPEPYEPDYTRGLQITLSWDTPGAVDVDDSPIIGEEPDAGADLDLHLLHALARSESVAPDGLDFDDDGVVDGWFDLTFDAFFKRQGQQWGIDSPIDDPWLDRDDLDGYGPESIYLERPESGRCYTIGVHVWNDNNYGPSEARVKVFWDLKLTYLAEDVKLPLSALWEVGTLCASATGVTFEPAGCTHDADCQPKIMLSYPVPKSFGRVPGP